MEKWPTCVGHFSIVVQRDSKCRSHMPTPVGMARRWPARAERLARREARPNLSLSAMEKWPTCVGHFSIVVQRDSKCRSHMPTPVGMARRWPARAERLARREARPNLSLSAIRLRSAFGLTALMAFGQDERSRRAHKVCANNFTSIFLNVPMGVNM